MSTRKEKKRIMSNILILKGIRNKKEKKEKRGGGLSARKAKQRIMPNILTYICIRNYKDKQDKRGGVECTTRKREDYAKYF